MKRIKKHIIFSILGLAIVSLILSIWIPITQAFKIVFGSFLILFLPGLVLSFVFFNKKEIDIIERAVLSFALSITVIPLLVFYLNLVGVKINILNVLLITGLVVGISIGVILWQRKKKSLVS